MSKELVIGSNRHETKVAILEDDQLVEVYFQRANEYSLAGSIHKGRVTRVLPGMQSAFVDVGLERDTFLYVSDFFEDQEEIDTVVEDRGSRRERPDRGDRGARPDRGGRFDRNPRRSPERMTERVTEAPENAAREVQAASAVPESENIAAVAEVASAEPSENRAAEPNESDRGFRGDRRNRRGRRRRQRGRGFPENKYAQPTPSHTPPVTGLSAPGDRATATQEDVLILPGESLAKYRYRTGDAESSEHPEESGEHLILSETEETPLEPIDPEENEAIEEEADELELSQKVFAHHDDE